MLLIIENARICFNLVQNYLEILLGNKFLYESAKLVSEVDMSGEFVLKIICFVGS